MDFFKVKIEKNPKEGAFTQDALFLSMFLNLKNQEKILELGTGTGVISILLALHYPDVNITAVEIMEEMYNAAKCNIEKNLLCERIELINNDFRNISLNSDVIVMNPPFVKKGSGKEYKSTIRESCRSERFCSMEDILRYSSVHLNKSGKLYLIYPVERFSELLNLSAKYSIMVKRLRFIHLNEYKKASRFMFEGIAYKNAGLTVEPPLFIYTENGEYTEELRRSFYGE